MAGAGENRPKQTANAHESNANIAEQDVPARIDKEQSADVVGGGSNPWRAIGMASAIGADLVVSMGAGFGLGLLMKNWFGGHPGWIVLGIMLGFSAGVIGLIWLLRFYMEERNG